MKFNKHHKVIIDTLNKEEGEDRAYIDFLLGERERHEAEIWEARLLKSLHQPLTGYKKAKRRLYNSAIRRHKEDIEDIDKLIAQVKEKFES